MKKQQVCSILIGLLVFGWTGVLGAYDVTTYGAIPNDAQDDTAAIERAIEAARSAGGGTVYFPAGVYEVSPAGRAVVSVHKKLGGVWVLQASSVQPGQIVSGWLFTDQPPVAMAGAQAALNVRTGRIEAWSAEGWRPNGTLLEGAGAGWHSGFGAPPGGTGVEGDMYLQHYEIFDHLNAAVFELEPTHSGIHFLGDGIGRSVISFNVWSGKDPMDYEVNTTTRTVVRAAIPRNSSGRYVRGSLFVLKQVGTGNFRDISWDGLEMRGNTVASGKDSWYTPYDDLEEWDISNKGIVFSFGALPMYGLAVRNSSIHGWRGEILYKGGSNYAEITIESCDIYETNSSAVSISGNMILRDSRIWNTYNGVENYCDEGQFSEIYNCDIDLDRSFRGHFGVVYLGTPGAHLKVQQSRINGAINGAVFLSDFAHNVEVSGNAISNCEWGVYIMYMNLYGLPGGFNNLLVENNVFTAAKYRFGHVIMNAAVGIPEKDWTIRGNTVVSNGQPAWFFFRSDTGVARSQHNVVLTGNTLPQTTLYRGTSVLPVFEGNSSKPVEVNTWTATNGVFPFSPDNPEFVITNLVQDGVRLAITDLTRYPVGHRFTVRVMHPDTTRGLLLGPAAWNTLSTSIRLVRGEEETFIFNAAGRFERVDGTVVPPAPEPVPLPAISAVPFDTQTVKVEWTVEGAVDGFDLELSVDGAPFSPMVSAGGSERSRLVAGLSWQSLYTWRIRALRDGAFSEWAQTGSVSPLEPPLVAPSGLIAVAADPGRVAVAWEATDWVDGYEVEMAPNAQDYVPAGRLDPTTVQWISGELTADTGYYIRVRSVRGDTVSDWVWTGPLFPTPYPPVEPPQPELPQAVHAWYFEGLGEAAGIDSGWGELHLDLRTVAITTGIDGQGIRFGGNHRGVRIPESTTLNRDVRDRFTVSLWIRPDADSVNRTAVLYEQGGFWRGLNLLLERGRILACGWNKPPEESGWAGTLLQSSVVTSGEWTHIAVVLNGGPVIASDAFKLYVNGTLQAAGPGSQIWKQNEANGLGQVQKTTLYRDRQVRTMDPFHGDMDAVTIYHDALSAEEVQALILRDFPEPL